MVITDFFSNFVFIIEAKVVGQTCKCRNRRAKKRDVRTDN